MEEEPNGANRVVRLEPVITAALASIPRSGEKGHGSIVSDSLPMVGHPCCYFASQEGRVLFA